MVKVTRARRTWRAYGDADCPECRGEGCDDCRRFSPVGVTVELDDGTVVRYSFRSGRFTQLQPTVTDSGFRQAQDGSWKWQQGGEPKPLLKPVGPSMSLREFARGNPGFALTVVLAILEVAPELEGALSL